MDMIRLVLEKNEFYALILEFENQTHVVRVIVGRHDIGDVRDLYSFRLYRLIEGRERTGKVSINQDGAFCSLDQIGIRVPITESYEFIWFFAHVYFP